jgi:L-lysine 2,3-aminomutase
MKCMIGHNSNKISAWQTALVQAITNPRELIEILELDKGLITAAEAAAKLFPLIVPRGFVARMQKGNKADPLLLQVLPLGAEQNIVSGYSVDPLQESAVNPIPGLLHKYHGRVLLTLVGTCAVNCRYCFRRHFPYADNNPGMAGWDQALNYIAQDKTINEVILSGGDPLVANDKILYTLSDKLNAIPHVKRLRIHSRLPIVLPERINAEFIAWCKQLKQRLILVTHCNHAQEICARVRSAMSALTQASVLLLNQTVLLKGVNDKADSLINLSEALFDAGIQPYYLHTLDKVQGAAHFDLSQQQALHLHQAMAKHLPGFLVPRLVQELPGATAKVAITGADFCTDK